MQDRIKENERVNWLAHTQTYAVSEHANNTGHNLLWIKVKFIGRYPRAHAGSKRHRRPHPNNINRDSGIDIPEAWMPTIKNTTTGEPYDSGLPRKQHTETVKIKMHQLQLLKTNQSQSSILLKRLCVTSQPSCLIKTSSKQLKQAATLRGKWEYLVIIVLHYNE